MEKMRSEELKAQQAATLDDLRSKMSKLQSIAQQYGISLDSHDENQRQYQALMEQHEALQKQKRVLQQSIEASSKKYETQLTEKKKEFDQLQYTKAKIVHGYNEKVQILRSKGAEIQDLIEKARNQGADQDLQGVLKKWEDANKKIFEKYPNEHQNDLSILE